MPLQVPQLSGESFRDRIEGERPAFPLAFGQERTWHYSRLGNSAAPSAIHFDVQGDPNVSALRQSLSEIVRRHEILRTNIVVCADRPVQIVRAPTSVELAVADLSAEADPTALVDRLVQAECLAYRFEEGSPFRVHLMRLGEDEYRLVFILHHVFYDLPTLHALFHELEVLYEACCWGEESPLPEPVCQFRDFAVWERTWLQPEGAVWQQQFAYWKERLNAPGPLPLSFLRPVPAPPRRPKNRVLRWLARLRPTPPAPPSPVVRLEDCLYRVPLANGVLDQVRDIGQREGCTLFMTLLAALKVVLHRDSRAADMMIGTYVQNRPRPEFEKLFGFFSNYLILRTDLSGDPSFAEVLQRVRDTTLAAFANQNLPLEDLLRRLQAESPYWAPHESRFRLTTQPLPLPALTGLTVRRTQFRLTAIPTGLAFGVVAHGNAACDVLFDGRKYDPAGVRQALRSFANLLTHFAINVNLPISKVHLNG